LSCLLSKKESHKIRKTAVLPVTSLTLREEYKQNAEENTGSKRDEVTESWGKLHIEELYNLYKPNQLLFACSNRSRSGLSTPKYDAPLLH
jgi:hypothetical protein